MWSNGVAMRDFRQRTIRHLYRDARRLSRNRHFHAYLDPQVKNAALIARLLRSLRHDLLNRPIDRLTLQRLCGVSGDWFLLEMAWEGARRTSYLTEFEINLLREDAQLAEILARAGGREEGDA
ncbi:MAG: hypothetical protein JW797_17725 [Bradymonadales bacterium]|nr:hypothetical protein [Bradymonadales bacterium]